MVQVIGEMVTAESVQSAIRAAIVDTVVAERSGVLTFARAFVAQLPGMVERGKLPAVDADALRDRVLAFADQIATGLHREDPQMPEVRAAMRQVVREKAA